MSVGGYLDIKTVIWCPECSDCIDLFKIEHLLDDGWIYDVLLTENNFGCKNFYKLHIETFGEDFKCSHCKKVIYIDEINW